jgi:dCTP deaminase
MILPAQMIAMRETLVSPFCERSSIYGMTYGLGPAGYDVRVNETFRLEPGDFKLASTIEHFQMPTDLIAFVHDKSTWARRGLSVFNTVIEPGWKGWLTLELVNNGPTRLLIEGGMPIAQVIWHQLMDDTTRPYDGKYQNQQMGPQNARYTSG